MRKLLCKHNNKLLEYVWDWRLRHLSHLLVKNHKDYSTVHTQEGGALQRRGLSVGHTHPLRPLPQELAV